MGIFYNSTQPVIDISLNSNDLTTVSWNNFCPGADQYKVKVDGTIGIVTTTNSVGILTVSSGLSRVISLEAYQNNNLVGTVSKYVKIFDYVGIAQTWTVPSLVRHLFADVQGASGGDSGGLGGRAKSYISVNAGESLNFYCGGAGGNSLSVGCTSIEPSFIAGGFNGGGRGGGTSDSYGCGAGTTSYGRGASGGGASDIRRIDGDLNSRIIVAGGGGGGPTTGSKDLVLISTGGCMGGGENGVDGGYSARGSWNSYLRGTGATTTSAGIGGTGNSADGYSGTIGIGGSGSILPVYGDGPGRGSGGGGGYYGGGGGGAGSNYGSYGGGGGGSGYIDPTTKSLISLKGLGTISSGYRTGNGKILVSWFSPNTYSDIVTSGLVLNLDAQNYYSYPGSGTTWTDLSGNGNTGTLTNGPTYSSTNSGSIVFDGVDDYTTLSSSQLAPGTGAFTWNFWIKLNDVSNLSIIFSGTGSNSGYGVIFANSAGYGLGYYASGYAIVDSPTLGSSWWYITFTGNGGADGSRNLKLYRNTIQAGSTYNINYNFTSTTPIIGANHSSFAELMRGNVSNVSYYNRALSAAEISQNFNALRSRYAI